MSAHLGGNELRGDRVQSVVWACLCGNATKEVLKGAAAGAAGELPGPESTGTGAAKPPREKLSTIIEALNQRFGLDLPDHVNDFVNGVSDAMVASDEIRLGAEANDRANFAHVFHPALENTMAEHHEENASFVELFFQDEAVQSFLKKRLLDEVYERIVGGREEAGEGGAGPLRRVLAEEVRPFVNAVPVYELEVAAGRFGHPQVVSEVQQEAEVASPEDFEWVALDGTTKPAPGLFVARVVGESMNRRIPNGAWCLWRLDPSGSRQGKVVLAALRDAADPELGSYTVKRYESEKELAAGDSWRHTRVTLAPDSTDPSFEPLVFEADRAGDLRIVAELIEVLA